MSWVSKNLSKQFLLWHRLCKSLRVLPYCGFLHPPLICSLFLTPMLACAASPGSIYLQQTPDTSAPESGADKPTLSQHLGPVPHSCRDPGSGVTHAHRHDSWSRNRGRVPGCNSNREQWFALKNHTILTKRGLKTDTDPLGDVHKHC